MSNKDYLLTPIGRLVQGSLYDPQTKNAEGDKLIDKNGQEYVRYFFALAIPKGPEQNWQQTPWGAKIYAIGVAGFPAGQYQSPSFAWKIKDGDSNIPNTNGTKPCDCEGFPGHWVLSFSSYFPPSIVNADGSAPIIEKGAVNLGDYVQVAGNIVDNGSSQKPGVFLNHTHVAFAGYGKRIVLGIDPKNIGFGANVSAPAGMSATPLAAMPTPTATPHNNFSAPLQNTVPAPAPLQNTVPAYMAPPASVTQPVMPPPHTGILTPSAPPARIMLPAANGIPYEQYKANNWTDEQLIQYGMMQG